MRVTLEHEECVEKEVEEQAGKAPVFGLLKRNGKCSLQSFRTVKESSILIIQVKITKGSTIHSDGWKAYDGLILNGYDHYRKFHNQNEFALWQKTFL